MQDQKMCQQYNLTQQSTPIMIGYIYVYCSLVLVFLYLQIFPPHCFPLVLFRVRF